ncbi:E3 ubiquitin-protein ligase UPL6 [Camellia lanceoleosa]|nr:E3 ubiquitin-protein ligase UPL6 [Camellia lanceoleosa]
MTSDKSSTSTILLLEAVVMLIDYFDDVLSILQESIKFQDSVGKISSLEGILALIIPHVGQRSCVCANIDPRSSLSSQILTIPFLWKVFPYLKEQLNFRYACLLGNLLKMVGVAFSQPDCSFDMAIDFVAVATFLLEALPPMQSSNKESKEGGTQNSGFFQLEPGPNKKAISLPLRDEDYTEDIKDVHAYLDKVKKIVRPGCSQEVLNVAVSSMSSLARILSAMSSKPKPRASL